LGLREFSGLCEDFGSGGGKRQRRTAANRAGAVLDVVDGTDMTLYVLTGGTGMIGRHLLERLLRRPDTEIHVLVRNQSVGRLQQAVEGMDGRERVIPLIGDLTEDKLGLRADVR
jgi:NAD(P)-dependent dehydrogenase (short-subunit alcohol dehydrogenase family)